MFDEIKFPFKFFSSVVMTQNVHYHWKKRNIFHCKVRILFFSCGYDETFNRARRRIATTDKQMITSLIRFNVYLFILSCKKKMIVFIASIMPCFKPGHNCHYFMGIFINRCLIFKPHEAPYNDILLKSL